MSIHEYSRCTTPSLSLSLSFFVFSQQLDAMLICKANEGSSCPSLAVAGSGQMRPRPSLTLLHPFLLKLILKLKRSLTPLWCHRPAEELIGVKLVTAIRCGATATRRISQDEGLTIDRLQKRLNLVGLEIPGERAG